MRHFAEHNRCGISLLLLLAMAGCAGEQTTPPPRVAVPSDKDALDFVGRFFQAYVRTDIDTVRDMLCEKDPDRLLRTLTFIQESQAPFSPFRIDTYQVRSAAAFWIGKAPYFRVEVSFPRRRSPGQILHIYTVRATDGCMEQFLEDRSVFGMPNTPSPPPQLPGNAQRSPTDEGAPQNEPAPLKEDPSLPPLSDEDEVFEL